MKWLSDLAIGAMMLAGFAIILTLVYLIDHDTFPPNDDHD
jgi:hypothetical protein